MHEFDLGVLGFEMPELDKFLNDGEIGPEMFGGSRVATGKEDVIKPEPLRAIDSKEYEAKQGATEYGEDEFQNFTHTCPRCGFSFDGKKDEPAAT
jgi:hypothetical protein